LRVDSEKLTGGAATKGVWRRKGRQWGVGKKGEKKTEMKKRSFLGGGVHKTKMVWQAEKKKIPG